MEIENRYAIGDKYSLCADFMRFDGIGVDRR